MQAAGRVDHVLSEEAESGNEAQYWKAYGSAGVADEVGEDWDGGHLCDSVGDSAGEDVGHEKLDEDGGGIKDDHEDEEGESDFEKVGPDWGVPEDIDKVEVIGMIFLYLILMIFLMDLIDFLKGDAVIVDGISFGDAHDGIVGLPGVVVVGNDFDGGALDEVPEEDAWDEVEEGVVEEEN